MDQFLAGVEKRAYRMAVIATGNSDDALDIVQDSMLKLVKKYANRTASEWGPLFHRILQSTIRDWYRRQSVRNRWRTIIGKSGQNNKGGADCEDIAAFDPIENAEESHMQEPMQRVATNDAMETLEEAIHALPLRQQQAFLLRVWEGLSVEAAAQAMGCSQGSVKTHYSRAVHNLRNQLENYVERV